MSSTSEVVAGEEESRVAEDAYANYQQYYQQYAEQQPQHQPQHQPQVNPNPFGIHGFGIQNKQDFTSDIKEMLGPEAGVSSYTLYLNSLKKRNMFYVRLTIYRLHLFNIADCWRCWTSGWSSWSHRFGHAKCRV